MMRSQEEHDHPLEPHRRLYSEEAPHYLEAPQAAAARPRKISPG